MRPLLFLILLSTLQAFSQNIFLTPLAKSPARTSALVAARVTRGGDLLALCSADKSISIVDANTLLEKYSFHPGNLRTYTLAFTRNGKNLVSASPDGRICVWDYALATPMNTITAVAGIRSIDIDSAGTIMICGYDKTIRFWNGATGKQLSKSIPVEAEVMVLSYSADGQSILAGCSDGSIMTYNAASCALMQRSKRTTVSVTSAAFSSDGKYFAASFYDSTVSLFNARTGAQLTWMKNPDGNVTSVAFHPNNKFLITASGTLSFWDVATGVKFSSVTDTSMSPALVSVSAERSLLAVCGRNGELRTYSMSEKKADAKPPLITLMKPVRSGEDQIKLFASEVTFTGIVSDESGIAEVSINGKTIPTVPVAARDRKAFDTSFTVLSLSATLPLTSADRNTFVVAARDAENNTSQRTITVTKLTKDSAVEVINAVESTDQSSIDLEFKIWFDFSSYAIYLNTLEIAGKEKRWEDPVGMSRTHKISLSAGINQIQVIVNGRGGEKIRKVINIARKVISAAPVLAADAKAHPVSSPPQCWAVIVGISEYANKSIKNLTYADNDARAMATFLQTSAGGAFQEDRIKLLLNKNATLDNVKQALFSFLRQTIDKDLVVIFFAGHGAPEPGNPKNGYLLCYNTDPKSLATSAFPMWDVNTALTRFIPSKRVIVFTDACHSGGITSDLVTRGMAATDDDLNNQFISDLSKTNEGIVVFTASQAGEVSQELDKYGHGVFTHFLLEGMQGKADSNNDYTVTIGELMDYVEENVRRQTNGNQHPTRNQGSYDKELVISVIPH